MMRDKINRLRHSLQAVPRIAWAVFGIVCFMTVLAVGGLISFLPIGSIWHSIIFIVVSSAALGYGVKLLLAWNASDKPDEPEVSDHGDDTPEQPVPPMPTAPPKISLQDSGLPNQPVNDPTFAVLKKISDQIEAAALEKKQEAEDGRKAAEAKAKLLADDTVYYDERPKMIYYVRRDLWKTLIAWAVGWFIISTTTTYVQTSETQAPIVIILIIIGLVLWFTIRWYGDWAWTRRRLEGNLVVVQEPSNGWFGHYGKVYSISLLDCGNVVVAKTWYERVLRLSSGTISIETVLENKESTASGDTVRDVFKYMRNMRDPDRFRSIVLKRHDELTFGQPDVIRRTDH